MRRKLLVGIALGGFALAGCSEDDDYENKLRPPSPINITAYVDDKGISVSPAEFGAGPIVLIVTNQAKSAQSLTLGPTDEFADAPSERGSTEGSTGEITSRGTGRLKIDLEQGNYTLKASTETIRPAALTVGASRPSAQNAVLQP